jgi:hypothetical protein
MRTEVKKAVAAGIICTGILGALIVIGSRNLDHFDAALVAYTFSVLFATFGLAYRYTMWLQRPPTAMYWRRGWQAFFKKGARLRHLRLWGRRVFQDILGNRFIFRRNKLRGLTHMLIMWGCLLAVAITFPLVFGWLHFQPYGDSGDWYQAMVFGFPTIAFPAYSLIAKMMFHGLVWASFLVIPGVMLAMRRRMRDEQAATLQRFVEDFTPLILLFAVSVTGLMLTASYSWMRGFAFDFIAITHAITVIATFLWLPFGKFFHIFQRPAQLGVSFYQDVGRRGEKAHCRRCDAPFTSKMHVEDLIEVEGKLGYDYEVGDASIEHYQWICPKCRRAGVALAQGALWEGARGGQRLEPVPGRATPTPVFANAGMDQGPLGDQDAENFHP